MSTDNTIVAQTSAKVAAELVAATQPRNIEDALTSYDVAFKHVLNSISFVSSAKETKKTKGGRQVPIISQDGLKSRLDDALRAGSAVTTSTFQV